MLIVGYICAAIEFMPTGSSANVGEFTIENCGLDTMLAKNVDTSDSSTDIDFNTDNYYSWSNGDVIAYSDYNADDDGVVNCGASTMDKLSEVTEMRLKRRESEDDNWMTIAIMKTDDPSDFIGTWYDRLTSNGKTYQYILVPVINGNECEYLSGNMTQFITSQFDGIFISSATETWGTRLNLSYTRQRNKPSNLITTLSGKYPFVINNSETNYYSGNVSGLFVQILGDGCCVNSLDLDGGASYRDKFYDFLTNGEPKVLRTDDGLSMIIDLTDGTISEDASESKIPITSFEYVQIGDANNYDDLYANGLISE